MLSIDKKCPFNWKYVACKKYNSCKECEFYNPLEMLSIHVCSGIDCLYRFGVREIILWSDLYTIVIMQHNTIKDYERISELNLAVNEKVKEHESLWSTISKAKVD